MYKKFLYTITLAIALSACSVYRIDSEDITTEYYPSKSSPSEVVYLEEPDRNFKIIGYVKINAERRQRLGEIIEKMKREAAILGADGITNIKSDATGRWKQLPAQDIIGNGYVRANFTSTAIVFN